MQKDLIRNAVVYLAVILAHFAHRTGDYTAALS